MSKSHICRLFVTVLVIASCGKALCQDVSPRWEDNLLNLKVGDLEVEENSLLDAWKTISSKTLAHSILFARADSSAEGHFKTRLSDGTVHEWLDALVAAYPKYTWDQDGSTRVIWIHPKDIPLDGILPNRVNVTRDDAGLRMLDDVLLVLDSQPLSGIITEDLGSLFENTFDYPMNLLRGETSTREVINQCCAANPTIGFLLQRNERADRVDVAAVNLPEPHSTVSAAPLAWWRGKVDPLSEHLPTMAQIQDALADHSQAVREGARNYLDMNIWNVDLEQLLHSAPLDAKGLWTAVGVISVMVHTSNATEIDAIKTIKKIFRSAQTAQVRKDNPALYLLAGLELYRVADDRSILDSLRKLSLDATALSAVHDDLDRIIHAISKQSDREFLYKALPILSVLIPASPLFEIGKPPT